MSKHHVGVNCPPADRKQLVPALRRVGMISLRQAVELADHFEHSRGATPVAGLDHAVARHLADGLREAGAEIEIGECGIGTRMLCAPQVDARNKRGPLRTIGSAA